MYLKSTIKRTAVQSTELVSLAKAKAHLRVSHSAEDTLIAAYIKAAKQWVEEHTGLMLFTEEVQEVYESFPSDQDPIILHGAPFVSVASLKYRLATDTGTEITLTDYYVQNVTPVAIKSNTAWPTGAMEVKVAYTVGYGDEATDIPEPIQIAVLLLVGDMYENRQDSIKQLPTAAEYLLRPYLKMQIF